MLFQPLNFVIAVDSTHVRAEDAAGMRGKDIFEVLTESRCIL